MATKNFVLNTEPHVADIGGTPIRFTPEVFGDEFMEGYQNLRALMKTGEVAEMDPADLKALYAGCREFLSGLMADDDSRAAFATLRLPDRVLTELLEWVMEVYSAGRPTGRSGGSATSRPKAGTRGTGGSPSRA